MDGGTKVFRATQAEWERLLEEFGTSGKSVRGFCRENGISHWQLYYHVRRGRKEKTGHGFIELARETPGELWIEAGKCRIHVQRGFDAELLRQVAAALS
jgi:hypothetical protein